MSQFFQVLLQVKAVQHMIRIRKSLAQRCNPPCTVSVNADSLHTIEIIPLVHTGLYLVVERLCIHPVTADMQRID